MPNNTYCFKSNKISFKPAFLVYQQGNPDTPRNRMENPPPANHQPVPDINEQIRTAERNEHQLAEKIWNAWEKSGPLMLSDKVDRGKNGEFLMDGEDLLKIYNKTHPNAELDGPFAKLALMTGIKKVPDDEYHINHFEYSHNGEVYLEVMENRTCRGEIYLIFRNNGKEIGSASYSEDYNNKNRTSYVKTREEYLVKDDNGKAYLARMMWNFNDRNPDKSYVSIRLSNKEADFEANFKFSGNSIPKTIREYLTQIGKHNEFSSYLEHIERRDHAFMVRKNLEQ